MDILTRIAKKKDKSFMLSLNKTIGYMQSEEEQSIFNESLKLYSFIIIEEAGTEEMIGYMAFASDGDDVSLCYLAISPEYRRKGVAEAALTVIEDDFSSYDAISLEVRKSNYTAIRLYRRLGYITQDIVSGYYHDPEEDAVKMKKFIKHKKRP